MTVTVARCRADELPEVVRFIDEYWSRGHALVRSRALLDWQHRDADGRYSFVVARRQDDGAVVGILGFISTKRFDPALASRNVVWLTTWKVREDAGIAGLGLSLLRRLSAEEPHVAIGAIGFKPATRPIYEALGYELGELRHYAMPNPDVRQFTLLSMSRRPVAATDNGLRISTLSGDDLCRGWLDPFRSAGSRVPQKTMRYLYQRYVCHPVYTYRITGVLDGNEPAAVLVTRTAEHAGVRALRIVDFAGSVDLIARIGGAVQALLRQTDAEYADAYNAGIDPKIFERAGFAQIDPDDSDVVPDHFEPFERRNIRLCFALKSTPGHPPAVLFKGDSDQDRPSIVSEATV